MRFHCYRCQQDRPISDGLRRYGYCRVCLRERMNAWAAKRRKTPMPKILDKAVKEIKKNSPGVNPYAVATAALQRGGDLKPGTNKATPKGIARGNMTKAERAKTR